MNSFKSVRIGHRKENGDHMGFDLGQVNQLLSHIPYPISTGNLVQFGKQHGASDQIVGMLERLPEKTFNSPEDIRNSFAGLNNLRNLGNLGGFKF